MSNLTLSYLRESSLPTADFVRISTYPSLKPAFLKTSLQTSESKEGGPGSGRTPAGSSNSDSGSQKKSSALSTVKKSLSKLKDYFSVKDDDTGAKWLDDYTSNPQMAHQSAQEGDQSASFPQTLRGFKK